MQNNENLFCMFEQQMLDAPDRVLLKLHDSRQITYGEANALSARLANKLNDLGLQPGDRVTAQVEKSHQAVLLYLACLRAGIVFHPLNTAYTLNELDHFIQDAQPTLFVCGSTRAIEAQDVVEKTAVNSILTLDADGSGSLWDNISTFGDSFETIHRTKDETALLIYTSGTTGKPKGAMITHQNVSSNARSLISSWDWRLQDVLLHVLPLFHVHGLCVGLHLPMALGSKIVFQPRFSVERTIGLIPQSTVMMAVPTIYTRLLSDPRLNQILCEGMRLFISGSAPLLPETFMQFEQRTGHEILERYGMTEAQMITSNPLRGERISGTVGFPLHDVKLRICDDDGRALKRGEVGSLEIKGPNVFKGYWRNPDATQKAFRDEGYFVTGDVGFIGENQYLSIVGREVDLIISAGLNVYPREVELEINQVLHVSDSAVFGVPHPDLGEGVVAAVIRQTDELTESEIISNLAKNLSAFKVPRKIIFVDEFPRNAMGKIEKARLRGQYRSVFSGE